MVVLEVSLSCTVRRCTSSAQARTHLPALHSLMQRTAQNAGSYNPHHNPRDPLIKSSPYEDQILTAGYSLTFHTGSHDNARKRLLLEFDKELKGMDQSRIAYYLYVEPYMDESMLGSYFADQSLVTFSLGYMSSAVDFHVQFDYYKELYTESQTNPLATFGIDNEKISVDFVVSKGLRFQKVLFGMIADTTEVYRLVIDFKDLSKTLLVHETDQSVTLNFLQSKPLQLWRTQLDITDFARVDYNKTNWIRTCNIKSKNYSSNMKSFSRDTLGGCHVFSLKFPHHSDQVQYIIQSLQVNADFEVYYTSPQYHGKTTFTKPVPYLRERSKMHDKINWLLAAIRSIGYRVQCHVEDDLLRAKLMRLVERQMSGSRDEQTHLYNALCSSYNVLLSDCDRFLLPDIVLDHFLRLPKMVADLVTDQRQIKRLIITPSRILLQAPQLMHDNRILRAFDADSAVSCAFQNDDMTGFAAVACGSQFVDEVIGQVLREGVHVGERHYEFLGCSGSQLRSNGCWFYARDSDGKNASDIRRWMGDLEGIRNPGTYLSRMGQCFSDTTAAELETDINITWSEPDVMGGTDPDGKAYCFSDGVGRISEECLKLVFTKLTDEKVPSAIQVRLGGSKGMLTLDKQLSGKTIMVRKSMFKFKSSHTTVEVMRRTQPTPLFLNNQVITLLSQLRQKIPDFKFIRLLYVMLHRLADVLMDDSKALVALSQSGFSCCYSKLYKAGLKFTTDPFFKGVLKAVTCARISNVKQKTRIEIPHEYARAMLGVMDEEGVLEYGEVFVQYSANIKQPQVDPIILQGTVVVSKMPALHPGDIRKLKAVDKPELRHLVDCIVFPQRGPRPHPNEMAGSDLDGDEYFVTWHPDLIFSGENETPMDFPSVQKLQFDRPITVEDMVKFIVDYIANDKVGVICNAHLAWADKDTIHSQRCKDLARIFCHVIDYSKTGYLPEEVTGRNLKSLLPDEYPDFMGKEDHKETYPSDNVLGKLYRISRRLEQAVMTIDKKDTERINEGDNWTIDNRFLIEGYEQYTSKAENLYKIYAEYLDNEQRRYGIESEEEIVSGCVIKIKGLYSRSDEVYDIEKQLKIRMKDIHKVTLEKFRELLDEEEEESSEGRCFAAACYAYTYQNKKRHRSFPWIFADKLLGILKRTDRPGSDSPHTTLTKSMEELDFDEIERVFNLMEIEIPPDQGLARIYYVLVKWGEKSQFLPSDKYAHHETLRVAEFVALLDKVCEEDEEVLELLDGETGPLLCAIFRAITKLDDELRLDGGRLSRKAVINMKRQILLGHHQLAREPKASSLMIQQQQRIKRTIQVPRNVWDRIKSKVGDLKKEYKEKKNVKVEFRRNRQGGSLRVDGLESDVFYFTEFWAEEHHR